MKPKTYFFKIALFLILILMISIFLTANSVLAEMPIVKTEVTTIINHSQLQGLNWSESGHIFDTNLNVSPYNITSFWLFGNINWSYIQNAPISDWLSTYNETYENYKNIFLNKSGTNANQNLSIAPYNLTSNWVFAKINCSQIQGAVSDLCTIVPGSEGTISGTDGIWLYNDSTTHYFNETKLASLYYNKSEIDASLLNYLLLTDQRYNETGYINSNFYNKTQLDTNFSNYYNTTQTDNNFSKYINSSQIAGLYLNLSGGNANQNINISPYNLTSNWLFGNLNSSYIQNPYWYNSSNPLNFLNITTIGNSTIARNGTANCAAGQVVMNVTTNSSGIFGQCVVSSSSGENAIYTGSKIINGTFKVGGNEISSFELKTNNTSGQKRVNIGNTNNIQLGVYEEEYFDEVWISTPTNTSRTTEAKTSVGTAFNAFSAANTHFLYLGKANETFNEIYFHLATAGASCTLKFEYWNGAWTTLDVSGTDGTNNLANDGSITFTPPVDWTNRSITFGGTAYNMYWVRLSTTATCTPTVYMVIPSSKIPFAVGTAQGDSSALTGTTAPVFAIDQYGGVYIKRKGNEGGSTGLDATPIFSISSRTGTSNLFKVDDALSGGGVTFTNSYFPNDGGTYTFGKVGTANTFKYLQNAWGYPELQFGDTPTFAFIGKGTADSPSPNTFGLGYKDGAMFYISEPTPTSEFRAIEIKYDPTDYGGGLNKVDIGLANSLGGADPNLLGLAIGNSLAGLSANYVNLQKDSFFIGLNGNIIQNANLRSASYQTDLYSQYFRYDAIGGNTATNGFNIYTDAGTSLTSGYSCDASSNITNCMDAGAKNIANVNNITINGDIVANTNTLSSCGWEGNISTGAICGAGKIVAGVNTTSQKIYCCEL